jgi:hypothetical protein
LVFGEKAECRHWKGIKRHAPEARGDLEMPATRSKGNVVHDNLRDVTLKRGGDGEKE